MCEAGLKDPTAANKTTFGSGMFQIDRGSRQRSLLLRSARRIQLGTGRHYIPTLPVYPRMSSHPSSRNNSTAANQVLSGDLNAAAVSGPDQDRMNAANLDTVKQPAPAGEMFFNHSPGNPTSDPCRSARRWSRLSISTTSAEIFTAGRGTRSTTMVSIRTAGLHLRLCRRKPTGLRYQCGRSNSRVCGLEGRRGRYNAARTAHRSEFRMVYETFGDATDAAADVAVQRVERPGRHR